MDVGQVPSLAELSLSLLLEERRKLDADAAWREQALFARQRSPSPLCVQEYLARFWEIRKCWLEKLVQAKLDIDSDLVTSRVKNPGEGHCRWLRKHIFPMVEMLTQALWARLELQGKQWTLPAKLVQSFQEKTILLRQQLLADVEAKIAKLPGYKQH